MTDILSWLKDNKDAIEAFRNIGLVAAATIGVIFLAWCTIIASRQEKTAVRQAATGEANFDHKLNRLKTAFHWASVNISLGMQR